jgi:hypothetical protein
MRKAESRGVQVQAEQKAGHAVVTLDAVDAAGHYINDATTRLAVIDPRLENKELAMTQVAPGRYQAEFETPHPGSYHLEFTQKRGGQVLSHQSRGLAVGYPDELRLRPTNTGLLRALAEDSGGRFNPPAEAVFAASPRAARRATPLWPYLVAAAALLFVADVALRRIDLAPLANWLSRKISVPFAAR